MSDKHVSLANNLLGSGLLQPFRKRSFRLFWFGQTTSVLGDRVFSVALPFLVFELGGGAPQLGQVFAAYTIPELLFLLVGGVMVDRLPRRTSIILVDVVRAVLLILAVFLLVSDQLTLIHLFALSACLGLCGAIFMPATTSIMPELVHGDELVSANSLRSFATELTGIIGPPLAALMISFSGVAFALGFDGMTFIVGALALSAIPALATPVAEDAQAPSIRIYWKDLFEGFRYIFGLPWLWLTIFVFSFVNVFINGTVVVLLPLLAETQLGGAAAFGWLLSSMAVGSVVSALFLGRVGRPPQRGKTAYAGVALTGAALVILAFAPTLWLACTAAGIAGASLVIFGVIWESTLQELVPGKMLGRVASIDMLGSFALLPLGYLMAGWLVNQYSVGFVMSVAGVATVLLSTTGFLVPAIRRL